MASNKNRDPYEETKKALDDILKREDISYQLQEGANVKSDTLLRNEIILNDLAKKPDIIGSVMDCMESEKFLAVYLTASIALTAYILFS